MRSRRPLVAALLSFVFLAGLGQLYCGRVKRAATQIAIGLLVLLAYLWLVKFHGIESFRLAIVLSVLLALLLGLKIFSAVDAFLIARRTRAAPLAWYQRWYVYALIVIASGAFAVPFGWRSVCPTYSIPTASMSPTIEPGDIIVTEHNHWSSSPYRGELAVFRLPHDEHVDYVKRIVAIPGDTVQLVHGRLIVNGRMVDRKEVDRNRREGSAAANNGLTIFEELIPDAAPHLIAERDDEGPLDDTDLATVPTGHVFVLGDNRDSSRDSRVPSIGFVPLGNLTDKPLYVLWSPHLSRLGLTLR